MIDVLLLAAFYGIPIAVFIWMIVSVVKFVRTPKNDTELRKNRLLLLIISSSIFAVITVVLIVLCILFMLSLSHM